MGGSLSRLLQNYCDGLSCLILTLDLLLLLSGISIDFFCGGGYVSFPCRSSCMADAMAIQIESDCKVFTEASRYPSDLAPWECFDVMVDINCWDFYLRLSLLIYHGFPDLPIKLTIGLLMRKKAHCFRKIGHLRLPRNLLIFCILILIKLV